MMINFNEYNAAAAIPLVLALVQLIKMLNLTEKVMKFAPFFSLLFGIGISFLLNADLSLREVILSGITYGLGASGLYSSTKHTAHVINNEKEL